MFGPQLSVIVTSFRDGEQLRGALHNIRQQGIAELEILILDDGSVEVPQQLEGPVCLVRQPRLGISAARNAGLHRALGEFVAFLDNDDRWPSGTLSRLTTKLLNSDDDIVLGRMQNVMPLEGGVPDSSYDSPAQTLVSMCISAAVFRRSVFERVGEFDEALSLSADHEWLLRAREAGVPITIEAEVTLICRRRAAGLAQLTAWPTLERRAPRQPRHLAVSVVIPAWNAERYLPDALASVAAQSLPASEVLVVDDGSTDLTTALAESFGGPIRVLRQSHAGAAAARNLGVREARSEWVAFLDADDFWLPDRLAWQAATLRAEPTLDVLYGCVQQFYSPDLGWPDTAAHEEAAAVQPGIFPGTCLLRKRAFEQVGEFDTTLQSGVFIDWHTRALDSGLRVRTIDEVLLRRRIHHTDAAARGRQAQPDYVRNLKDALDRRRTVRPA
jgi:glycosyltransferase involved in cell wall biosynthesis